jgi:hypothetical protein
MEFERARPPMTTDLQVVVQGYEHVAIKHACMHVLLNDHGQQVVRLCHP